MGANNHVLCYTQYTGVCIYIAQMFHCVLLCTLMNWCLITQVVQSVHCTVHSVGGPAGGDVATYLHTQKRKKPH